MDDLTKGISNQQNLITNLLKSLKTIDKVDGSLNNLSSLAILKAEAEKIDNILKGVSLDNALRIKIEEKLKIVQSNIGKYELNVGANFGIQLDSLLNNYGMKLEGNFPKFKTSIYSLKADMNSYKVNLWFGNEQELLGIYKMVPEEIVNAILKENQRIKGREFNKEQFRIDLYKSYEMCLCRNKMAPGEAVLITEILPILTFIQQDAKFIRDPKKANFKEYDRVLFSYDLYKLKDRIYQNKELVLVTATHAETKNRSGFIWVMENEQGEGTPRSRLKFVEART